ncbi:hypothetical protein K6U52_05885 [Vibrio vulnificus]|nr:hypothetical protein [Vibrio vulnificus]MCG6312820.1 hypothetical protein [Vibrio vulnificus]
MKVVCGTLVYAAFTP